MAFLLPDGDVFEGNAISLARWATKYAQHSFPICSAKRWTCMTTKIEGVPNNNM
jgi:hypothetical protein